MMKNDENQFLKKYLEQTQFQSLYVAPFSRLALKNEKEEQELLGQVLSPEATLRFFHSLFGAQLTHKLKKTERVSAEIQIQDQMVNVDAVLVEEGVYFTLTKLIKTIAGQDYIFPQILDSFIEASSGLLITTHTQRMELDKIERSIYLKKMGLESGSGLYFRSRKETPVFVDGKFNVNVEEEQRLALKDFRFDSDVVRFGEIKNANDIRAIGDYLDAGSFVLAHVNSVSVAEGLVQLMAHTNSWESKFKLGRSLVGLLSFKTWFHDGQKEYAYEAYPFSSIAKEKFCSLSTPEFLEFFISDFKTNGLDIAQSLHTKVLKRSIDLRKAFELAPDPSHLDYMLKKSGL
ncbi:MAG: hypothetical protein M9899_04655 [Bdellovibrionaceae bacterium]|nr:hypothetical protein [Pseudobdellovibrionaceae bacterium]